MRRVKDDRDFAVYLLFSILTCGIYSIFFFYNLVEDLNTACEPMEGIDSNEKSPNYLLVLILGILTCGIYTFFWLYKQGNRIQRTGRSYGLDIDENGTTLLLWPLLGILVIGLGSVIGMYVSYFYLIKNTNKLCRAYNRKFNGMNDHNNNFSYQTPSQIPMTPQSSSGTLEFISGELQGTIIPINNQENIVIGRDPSVSNIILNSKDISRRHCEIQYNAYDNCYYIVDYSSYGLRVNGQQIQKNTPIRCMPGSKISLANGRNEFILK